MGTVFTHDHYGPSTHQQVGLYSTLLIEPEGSVWRHNETGALLGTRSDGGPASWQAIIEPGPDGPDFEAHREFYFEFADFQHAYERGGGALDPDFVDPGCVSARRDRRLARALHARHRREELDTARHGLRARRRHRGLGTSASHPRGGGHGG